MRWLDSVVDPIVDSTKTVGGWIGIRRHHDHGESSPLIDRNVDTETEAESPGGTSEHASVLSFSHEYRPFERSKKALIICAVHVVAYYSIAVGAYSFYFEPKWSIIDSLYFGVVTFTTIGYGDLSPSTDAGRLFTVFFALYGIGILGAFLSIIGSAVVEAGHQAMAKSEARAKKRVLAMFSSSDENAEDQTSKTLCREFSLATMRETPIIILLFILAILIGLPEGRSVISSIYFAVITATTIGFGDFHPSSTTMRAICIFYLPFSVAVFGQVLSKIASVYMDMKAQEADDAFLKRQLALRDLKAMDIDDDGKVSFGEFLSFILVAMNKIDKEDVDEIRALFNNLDVDHSGYLEKSDLVELAQEGSTMQLTDSIRRMGLNAAVDAH